MSAKERTKRFRAKIANIYPKNLLMSFLASKVIFAFESGVAPANQRKGQNEKFMNFAHFCEFWCLSLGKQAQFTLNFCSGMPLGKVHELTFLWFGLPGPLLIEVAIAAKIITKKLFTKKMFWSNEFCNNYKRITLENKKTCFLQKGHASGSNITNKIFWWNYFCNKYKNYYKSKCSKELFCNNFGQDGIVKKSPNKCSLNKCERAILRVTVKVALAL